MKKLHLVHYHFDISSKTAKVLLALAIGVTLLLIYFATSWRQTALLTLLMALFIGFSIFMVKKSQVSFTLTASHFQQHLFKGGWVVRWRNIESIGICSYQQDGWYKPLPWIGIRLKNYSPYLDAICPRIATDILLNQRALLYLGAKQHHRETQFEDIILDSTPYTSQTGDDYKGLQAMLANRMKYQREFFGYDIFISRQDLDREPEAFVGLARRYLAAAEPDEIS